MILESVFPFSPFMSFSIDCQKVTDKETLLLFYDPVKIAFETLGAIQREYYSSLQRKKAAFKRANSRSDKFNVSHAVMNVDFTIFLLKRVKVSR